MELFSLQPSPVQLAGLAALGLALLVLAMFLRRRTDAPSDRTSTLARVFLVLLRIAIGWHCLVEGLDKLSTPNWSSEPYLRESVGPLAPEFRKLAGDTLVAQLTTDGKTVSPELADEWQRYLDAFVAYYGLDADQSAKASQILENAKAEAIVVVDAKTKEKSPGWLVAAKPMGKPSRYPPPQPVEWTVTERLKAYDDLLDTVAKAEAELPEKGEKAWPEWLAAKADAARWRGELKQDIDRATAAYKEKLSKLLTYEQNGKTKALEKTKSKRLEANERPWDWNNRRDVADRVVKWGLVVVGVGLIAGCFTRLAAVGGAVLLLMFFLAMPPLPYLPDSPKAEGHYLYINKNIIEMLALLALACLPTGRWAGLDGLLQFLNPFNWRKSRAAEPVVVGRARATSGR